MRQGAAVSTERKASAVAPRAGDAVIVGCDSLFEFEGEAHGKPTSAEQAVGWLRRMRGEDDGGQPIALRHPLAALLQERAAAGGPDPAPLLAIEPLFGSLGQDSRLTGPVGHWLASLYASGAKATLLRAREELGF